jgi:hypothetical protein
MANCKKISLLICGFLVNLLVMAQATPGAAADNKGGWMRSEGKIYVVMVIVVTILLGLLIYLSRLDKKITKLEKGDNF